MIQKKYLIRLKEWLDFIEKTNIILDTWKYMFLFLILFSSCKEKEINLKPVSYNDFDLFVNDTKYITDAEKYGWSIVQIDVYNFKKVDNANWRKPDGINKVSSGKLPVTQVSYNDALAFCKWSKKRLPNYDEYWEIVKNDKRIIVSENKLPISEIDKVTSGIVHMVYVIKIVSIESSGNGIDSAPHSKKSISKPLVFATFLAISNSSGDGSSPYK